MKRRAFTLIEILIVIIVIAALAGILFITMGSGDAKAKEAACLGERNKIKTAFSTQLNMNSRDDFQTALNTVVTNESPSGTGTITDVTTDSSGVKHAVCSGLCKSGGKYHVDYVNGIMYISCDIHGGDEYNLTTAKNIEPGFTPNGEPGNTGGGSTNTETTDDPVKQLNKTGDNPQLNAAGELKNAGLLTEISNNQGNKTVSVTLEKGTVYRMPNVKGSSAKYYIVKNTTNKTLTYKGDNIANVISDAFELVEVTENTKIYEVSGTDWEVVKNKDIVLNYGDILYYKDNCYMFNGDNDTSLSDTYEPGSLWGWLNWTEK